MNTHSDKNAVISINEATICSGDRFTFVRATAIEGFGPIEPKVYLTYKRQSDNLRISFTLNQAVHFTVYGSVMTIANPNKLVPEITSDRDFNKISKSGLNFVDSFTVIKGNDGIAHHPNLDIDQPLYGIGIDWMKSSIQTKEFKRQREEHQKENYKRDKIKREKEEIIREQESKRISTILKDEHEKSSFENGFETLTRHFLKLDEEFLKSTFSQTEQGSQIL